MKTNENPQRSRAPRGVVSQKPVAMRLTQSEISELEALSLAQNRSFSSMARLIYLQGMAVYQDTLHPAMAEIRRSTK